MDYALPSCRNSSNFVQNFNFFNIITIPSFLDVTSVTKFHQIGSLWIEEHILYVTLMIYCNISLRKRKQ